MNPSELKISLSVESYDEKTILKLFESIISNILEMEYVYITYFRNGSSDCYWLK